MDKLPPYIPPYLGGVGVGKCSKEAQRAYQSITDQISRCYNPKSRSYRWYGAKGVRVMYERKDFVAWWLFHIKTFKGDRPSVSRLDHSKHYSFDNIKLEERRDNTRESLRRMVGRPWLTAKRRPVRMVCVKTGAILRRAGHAQEMADMTGYKRSNICTQAISPHKSWGRVTGIRFEFDQ